MLTPSSFTAIHTRVFSLEDSWAGCRNRKSLSDPQLEILNLSTIWERRYVKRGMGNHHHGKQRLAFIEHRNAVAGGIWPWGSATQHPKGRESHTCQYAWWRAPSRIQVNLGAVCVAWLADSFSCPQSHKQNNLALANFLGTMKEMGIQECSGTGFSSLQWVCDYLVAIPGCFFQGYSEVLQVSLHKTLDILSLKPFPTFQAGGILFIIPLYLYCTALVTICAHIQTHTKAGGIAWWGRRSILSIGKVLVWSPAYPQN